MKKHVVIFEARGGTDKSKYGYRRDTYPIIESLKARGWTAEVIFYSDENRGEIYRYTIDKADAYVSRINPGNLKDETGYFQMLRELVHQGVKGLPHPDVMINYGAKQGKRTLLAHNNQIAHLIIPSTLLKDRLNTAFFIRNLD